MPTPRRSRWPRSPTPARSWCASRSTTTRPRAAVPEIRRKLDDLGVGVPLIGDFHYNGHQLLVEYPAMAARPGQVPHQPRQRGRQAPRRELPDHRARRAGARQAGAHRRQLGLARPGAADRADGRERRASRRPRDSPRRDDRGDARVGPALRRAGRGDRAWRHDRIIISAKVSGVRDLVDVYRLLAARCDYPLHLGLTEAGMAMKGIVASTAGLAILLNEGIGDTIRVSLTPEPGRRPGRRGARRAAGAAVARPALVPAPGLGLPRLRPHDQHLLPGDGRSRSRPTCATRCRSGQTRYPGVEEMRVAVMGCVVNGPGESKHADIGISPAGHVRGAGGAGLRGRRAAHDAARRGPRARSSSRHPRRLRRAALRRERPASDPARAPGGSHGGPARLVLRT